MNRRLLLAVALVASCRKKAATPPALDPELVALRDRVCACKDIECVGQAMREARRFDPSRRRSGDEETLFRQLKVCVSNVAPTPTQPAVPAKPHADAVLAAARTWQRAFNARLGVREATISYVESNGMLDAEHGQVMLAFGWVGKPVDDPKRKTGAPIPADNARPNECQLFGFAQGKWTPYEAEWCQDIADAPLRCSIEQIWKRAVNREAPTDALAVIHYSSGTWNFTITDDPRNVHFNASFPDDCPLAVEQP